MINNNIYPCFWMNGTAEKAGQLYARTFPLTRILSSTPMVTLLEVRGQRLLLLNGGPTFQPNPSLSIMVRCDREQDVTEIYNQLLPGGMEMMPLDSYPWSKRYGWVQDQYGISWQVILADRQGYEQKLVPTMMFTGPQNGRAEEAMNFYTTVFPDSEIDGILKYGEEGGDTAGNIQHAEFNLSDYSIMAMDSSHDHGFSFNEGGSLVVETADQKETDRLWESLTADGGQESQCGWLKDRFGFSWQIVPKRFLELIGDKDPAKVQRVMNAMMKMGKLNIAELEKAAEE